MTVKELLIVILLRLFVYLNVILILHCLLNSGFHQKNVLQKILCKNKSRKKAAIKNL